MSKTIKERHLEAIAGCCINNASANHAAERSEAITEEIVIEFAEWILKNNEICLSDTKFWEYRENRQEEMKKVSTQELFKLFKQETGL